MQNLCYLHNPYIPWPVKLATTNPGFSASACVAANPAATSPSLSNPISRGIAFSLCWRGKLKHMLTSTLSSFLFRPLRFLHACYKQEL